MTGLRVAVIGGGPKALHALERLVAYAAPSSRIGVTVLDPGEPGSGPAYAPLLDPALLVNLRADLVDAWPRTGRCAVAIDLAHPPFAQWAAGDAASSAPYPPRRDVGRYLRAAIAQVIADGAPRVEVEHRRDLVVDAHLRPGRRWDLFGTNARPLGTFDEVLVATGHGPPTDCDGRRLDHLTLPTGGLIVTRGFGLTTLDLVRLLDARDAWQCGTRVVALSRSGRPPYAKPEPEIDDRMRAACDAPPTPAWPPHGALTVDWLRATTLALAGQVLAACAPAATDHAPRALAATLAELESRRPLSAEASRARLAHSIAVATGAAPPDATAALGVAWRALQRGLARHGSFGGLPSTQITALRDLTAALELVAFGPPAAAAATLLAAIDAGAVEVRSLNGRPLSDELIGDADLFVDTVLPAPGIMPGSLLAQLRDRGLLASLPNVRGALVTPQAEARADAGSSATVPGLSVIGRPTEDWVLANDTLSRSMHSLADEWGRRIARRAAPGTLHDAGRTIAGVAS